MTAATKAVVEEWISHNLMSDGDYRAIHSVGTDGVTVEADGHMHLGELADLIESAERERCAKIALDQKRKYRGGNGLQYSNAAIKALLDSIADDIRSSKDRGGDPPQAETNSTEEI